MSHVLRISAFLFAFVAASGAASSQFTFETLIGRCRVLWVASGDSEISGLGNVVALHDANGDGVRDLLATGFREGSTATYFRLLSGSSGATLRTFYVPDGPFIAGVADFNGDSKRDVLVTAYVREASGDPPSIGRGRYRTSAVDVHAGLILWSRLAPISHPDFGIAVGVVSDRTGDDVSDVLLVDALETAPGVRVPQFHVLSGADGSNAEQLTAPRGASTFLGAGIASARLDDDAVADLIYSDILFRRTSSRVEARLWAVSGATGETLWTLHKPSDSLFGDTVLTAPDVDGDGVDDIVVASPTDRDGVKGSVYMLSGRTGLKIWSAAGKVLSGQFSRGLTVLPDLNGDGIAEIVAGGPASMPPMLIAGQPGHIQVLNGRDGKALLYAREVLSARDFSTHFGMSVAAPGDLDGDGSPDIVVGAPAYGPTAGKPPGLVVAFGAGVN
jgi:hypothetical protein